MSGGPPGLGRRALLRRGAQIGAGAVVGLSLAELIAACGDDGPGPQAQAVLESSIAVDLASYYAPFPDLKQLTLARAKAAGVSVLFSADPAGSRAQVDSVRRVTGPKGGFRVIAIGAFDAAAVDPLAKAALDAGLQIVAFLTPLEHRTAAITIDHDAAARTLVAAAAKAGRRAILVGPPPEPPVPDPFFPVARANAAALRTALEASPLGAPVVTAEAVGAADAESILTNTLRAYPAADVIVTASDLTALGAEQALAAVRGRAAAKRTFVGALGAPAVTAAATLDALDADGSLQLVVAPRLADLAAALVDVPHALLRKQTPSPAPVPVTRFTPGGAATRAARADYA